MNGMMQNPLRSKFIGIVVDSNDPTGNHRLKIRVEEFHEGVTDDQLPWCAEHKLDGWGNSPARGSFGPPPIGALIWVRFQNGDPLSGEYTGYVRTQDNKAAKGQENYPHRKGWQFDGDWVFVDRNTGNMEIKSRSGVTLNLDGASGAIVLNMAGANIQIVDCPLINVPDGDVVASGISLVNHIHGGIVPGPADTGKPK